MALLYFTSTVAPVLTPLFSLSFLGQGPWSFTADCQLAGSRGLVNLVNLLSHRSAPALLRGPYSACSASCRQPRVQR